MPGPLSHVVLSKAVQPAVFLAPQAIREHLFVRGTQNKEGLLVEAARVVASKISRGTLKYRQRLTVKTFVLDQVSGARPGLSN